MASFRAFLTRHHPFTTSAIRPKEVDLIAGAYLNKIREVVGKQNELLNSPELKKALGDQLNRLAQKFHLPDVDAVAKLNLQFEKAKVVSSVDELIGGQSVEAQLIAINESRVKYEAEQKAKKQAEQERIGELSAGGADYAKEFFPIPPPNIEAQQLAAAAAKASY